MAHIKLVPSWSYDYGEPATRLIKRASGKVWGGEDRRIFTKSASHLFQNRIDELLSALRPGDVPLHVIALGSQEKFGSNRNGDGFPEQACRDYAWTFEKLAYWYRSHKNKDPLARYGLVKAAAFNPEMSRVELIVFLNGTKEAAARNGGFVADEELEKLAAGNDLMTSMSCSADPDTPVLTKEGYKRIADIRVGDVVYTCQKNWKKVTEVMQRPYTGELVHVGVEGLPGTIPLTEDHPLWARVIERPLAVVRGQRGAQRWASAATQDPEKAFDWTHAGCLEEHSRISYLPIQQVPGYAAIDDRRLAELLGIFMAKGSLAKCQGKWNAVRYDIHRDDWATRGVPNLVSQLWPDIQCKLCARKHSKFGLALFVNSTDFARTVGQLVGTGARGKRIPWEIFNASREVKLAFVGRWLDGDGWPDRKGVHWSTVSYHLALQLRDLLASIQIPASIYRIHHPERLLNGRSIKATTEYSVNISWYEARELAAYSAKVAKYEPPYLAGDRRKTPSLRQSGDVWSYRVTSVVREVVENRMVYNFEVEDDHSYSMAGLGSHNCKIAMDRCSGCNNKARNRSEYCGPELCKYGGLRSHMGCTFEDGHQLHAINDEPFWFDISYIPTRQADLTAYASKADYLQKQAAHFKSGETLADEYHVAAPLDVELAMQIATPTGHWTVKRAEETLSRIQFARHLAEVEQRLLSGGSWARRTAAAGVRTPDLPLSQFAKIGSADGTRLLRALTDLGIFLTPSDFVTWMGDGTKEASLVAQVERVLPGIYGQLVTCEESSSAEETMRKWGLAGSLDPAQALVVSSADRQRAFQWAADYSLFPTEVWNRTVDRTVEGAEPLLPRRPAGEKQANDRLPAQALARTYALYKLAALKYLLEERQLAKQADEAEWVVAYAIWQQLGE